MRPTRGLPLILCTLAAPALGQAGMEEATSLTIYSAARPGGVPPELYRPMPTSPYGYAPSGMSIPGFAVVRQDRPIVLGIGRGEVRFGDVAALLDPTTVRFESLTDGPGTKVLEQDYRFDLVGSQRLLETYIGRAITVDRAGGDGIESVTGELLSVAGGIVIVREGSGGLRIINGYTGIRFPSLPDGLLTEPTLIWQVEAAQPGLHQTRVSYQTDGITWWADYNLAYRDGARANEGVIDIGAWVSIVNQFGAGYERASLKLIAGDVHRLTPPADPYAMYSRNEALGMPASGMAGFTERAFFEYHLYTLARVVDIPDRSAKQIELFAPVRGVPAEKVLIYRGLPAGPLYAQAGPIMDDGLGMDSNSKVDIVLRFTNAEAHGLGIPLPQGRIRVNKLNAGDGTLEFIGEDAIGHIPKDELVSARLGTAFDVVGERIRDAFDIDHSARWMEETITLKLRNRKGEPIDVIAEERLFRWVSWAIKETTHPFEKADASTIRFELHLEPDEEKIVTYIVRYTW